MCIICKQDTQVSKVLTAQIQIPANRTQRAPLCMICRQDTQVSTVLTAQIQIPVNRTQGALLFCPDYNVCSLEQSRTAKSKPKIHTNLNWELNSSADHKFPVQPASGICRLLNFLTANPPTRDYCTMCLLFSLGRYLYTGWGNAINSNGEKY